MQIIGQLIAAAVFVIGLYATLPAADELKQGFKKATRFHRKNY